MNKTFIRFINQKGNTNEKKKFKKYWNKKGFKVICYDMNNRAKNVLDFEKKSPYTNPFKKRMLKIFGRMLLSKCPIPFRFFSICSNGDVILCFNDWSKKNIMGNLNQSTIRKIFNSKEYIDIRKETKNHSIKNNMCEHCNLYNQGVWLS
jgi:radical SAM protein with 4Fe4S-binding SPASM domain